MLSLVLATILPIAFASAATSTNRTAADCGSANGTLNVYQHPNATSDYSIPAIVSIGSTLMNSTTKTWRMTNSIGTIPDSYNVVNPQAQQLLQYISLDTSSTINASLLSSPLPFAGCALTFALPSSSIGKTSSEGSCSNIFGQSCLNEIMQIAQSTSAGIPSSLGSSRLIDTCDTITRTLNNYITTSSKVCDKDGPSIAVTQGLDFSSANTNNCTNPPTPLPHHLFERQTPFQPGNYTTYDLWTKSATPILLALFSNATALNGAGGSFAQTYLTCTTPMHVTTGSHDPTSAADHSAVVGVKSVVGVALAINALVFLML